MGDRRSVFMFRYLRVDVLAQAKSLLDDRRSYDFALVSHVAPWIKQLGANLSALVHQHASVET